MTGTYREIYGELIKEVEKIEVEKAREAGKKAGIETGRKAGIMTTLVSLVKDGILTIKEAAGRANMSVESFEKILKE